MPWGRASGGLGGQLASRTASNTWAAWVQNFNKRKTGKCSPVVLDGRAPEPQPPNKMERGGLIAISPNLARED